MPRVIISEPGKTPQPYRFKLERKLVKIGRSSESDIILECGSASTNHCTMERVEGGYILRDNNSTNGIKLDDTPMQIIDLFDGMEVVVGDVPMKFQLSESEIETISEEEFETHQRKKLPPSRDHDDHKEPVRRKPSTSSPRAGHSARPQPIVQQPSSGGLGAFAILFLMLLAIMGGMTLRHWNKTGDFLPSKLLGDKNSQTEEKKDGNEGADATEDATAPAAPDAQ